MPAEPERAAQTAWMGSQGLDDQPSVSFAILRLMSAESARQVPIYPPIFSSQPVCLSTYFKQRRYASGRCPFSLRIVLCYPKCGSVEIWGPLLYSHPGRE